MSDWEKGATCPDCDVPLGSIHDINCDWAECSKCHNQLLSCECDSEENNLIPFGEETRFERCK